MKRNYLIVLMCVMLLSISTATSWAQRRIGVPTDPPRVGGCENPLASGDFGDNNALHWSLCEDGILTISGEGAMPGYSSSDAPWSALRDSIRSVVIEDGVTSIGVYAFFAYDLTSVSIPNSVVSIGDMAFLNCNSLSSVTIPASVTTIGINAFSGCSNLTNIFVDTGNTQYSSDSEGVLYNIDKTMLIACPAGKTGVFTIPNSVIQIENSAFFVSGFTSVTIPNSVTMIGQGAFAGSGLTSVIIPGSVTTLYDQSFSQCKSLTSIFVDPSNTQYASDSEGVLYNKDKTELLMYPGGKNGVFTIADSVRSIGSNAFFACFNLTSVTIPNSVTNIGFGAFENCTALTDVSVDWTMPLSVSADIFITINTSTLTLHVPTGTKELYEAADVWKDFGTIIEEGISPTSYPVTLKVIDQSKGEITNKVDDNNESNIVCWIDDNLKSQNPRTPDDWWYPMYNDSLATPAGQLIKGDNDWTWEITLNATPGTYKWNPEAKTLGWNPINPDMYAYTGDDDDNNLIFTVSDSGKIAGHTELVIPAKVPTGCDNPVASGDFGDKLHWSLCEDGTLTISGEGGMPDYYSSLSPWSALRDSIRSVVIEDKVTGIGDYAFSSCSNLTSATIPNSVTVIGEQAFAQSGITSITIPENVEYIGANAFWACPSLAAVYFNAGNCQTMGYYDDVDYEWWPAFWGDDALQTLVIGDKVKNIPDFAFCGGGLKTVSIPGNVEHIGFSAFSYCSQLTSINVEETNPYYTDVNGVLFDKNKTTLMQCPAGKTGEYSIPAATDSIDDFAFYGCSRLTNIVIPNSVKSIGLLAFELTGISELTIPESITNIGRFAFYACQSLETVNFNAINCTTMGYNGEHSVYIVFAECTSLHTLNIGTEVQNIPVGAFWECSGLTGELIIPNSVVSIENYAFDECSGLTSLTISNSVTTIGEFAFANCTALTDVSVDWATPLSVPATTFSNVTTSSVTLHVPVGTKALYEAADVWKDFGTIVEEGTSPASYAVTLKVIDQSKGEITNNVDDNNESNIVCWIDDNLKSQNPRTPDDWWYPMYNDSLAIPAGQLIKGDNDWTWEITLNATPGTYTWNPEAKTLGWNPINPDMYAYTGDDDDNNLIFTVSDSGKISGHTELVIPKKIAPASAFNFDADAIGQSYSTMQAWGWPDANTSATVTADPLREGNSLKMQAGNYDALVYFPVTLPEGHTVADIASIQFETYSEITDYSSIELFIAPVSAPMGNGAEFKDYPVYLKTSDGSEGLPAPIQIFNEGQWYPLSITREQIMDPAFNCEGNTPDFSAVNNLSQFLLGIGLNVAGGSEYYLDNISFVWKESGDCSQTWQLTPTMTAALDCEGVLTVSTTNEEGEAMPDYDFEGQPWFTYQDKITTVIINDGVTNIGIRAFQNCSNLASVSIPNSVTTIGDWAFAFCSGLTSIVIPNSVTSIGDWAFVDCSGLTSIVIPNSVATIGNQAFEGCSGLTSIVISNSVTSIGDWAFDQCSGLSGNLIIPNSVTSIGEAAFQDCSGLTGLIIGNSVSSIGGYAFAECRGITGDLIIPNSVTSIGEYAFNETGITGVTIGDSISVIEDGVFWMCGSLTGKVIIPNSVTSIGNYAFYECTSISELTIPESITYIGKFAFFGCQSLETVNYNAINCTAEGYIEDSIYPVFLQCESLHTLNIGEEVQTIPDYAFYGCSGLTSISIPNSVTTIGEFAFFDCTALTDVTVDWATPLSVPATTFSNVTTSSATLHVPAGTKALYEVADVWKDFGTIEEEPISVVPEEIQPVGTDGKGSVGLSLSIPSNATLTGSFKVQFPEGIVLDEDSTVLVPELAVNFYLSFTREENNTWLIEIKSNLLKSSMADEYQQIMNIAYIVNDSVPKGSYDVKIVNLDFLLDNGTPIKEDVLTIPVSVEREATSIKNISNTSFYAYCINNMLKVESPCMEKITVYSVKGVLIYSTMKNVGMVEIPVVMLPGSVYIIKGSVSGTVKVVK